MELIIIAAGNGKRMGNISVPKVLYPVNGTPNLKRILDAAIESAVFDRVYVVVKEGQYDAFEQYLLDNPFKISTVIVPINSGFGDGHALAESLYKINWESKHAVVVWGDVYIEHSMVFNELVNYVNKCDTVVVPVCKEQNPYVTILADNDMNITGADFSKLGEKHFEGLHDQSVFLINKDATSTALEAMHRVLWKNGRYISESKELNFLHVMHYLHNYAEPALCYITEYPTKSFNSIDEVKQIENR